jgi:putative sigma-54 modulation protein
MQLEVVARDAEVSRETERHVEFRVQRTFGRLVHWIRRVVVRLADVNGPKGGVDKVVALDVDCEHTGPMRFESRAETYERGLAVVLERSKRAILNSPRLGSRRPQRR